MKYILYTLFLSFIFHSCSSQPKETVHGKWEFVETNQIGDVEPILDRMEDPKKIWYYFGGKIWEGSNGKIIEFTEDGQIKGDYIPNIAVEKLQMTFEHEKGNDLVLKIIHPEFPKEPINIKIPVRFEDQFMIWTIEGFLEVKFKFVE